jgi:hypothetical protein
MSMMKHNSLRLPIVWLVTLKNAGKIGNNLDKKATIRVEK